MLLLLVAYDVVVADATVVLLMLADCYCYYIVVADATVTLTIAVADPCLGGYCVFEVIFASHAK